MRRRLAIVLLAFVIDVYLYLALERLANPRTCKMCGCTGEGCYWVGPFCSWCLYDGGDGEPC